MRRGGYILLAFAMLFLFSCQAYDGMREEKGKHVTVVRYDRVLNDYLRSGSLSATQKLTMDYWLPTKILAKDVLALRHVEEDSLLPRLQRFYSDTTLVRLMKDVEQKFPSLATIEKELTTGFDRLRHEVPDIPVPFVYSQVSAFNESIVVMDTLLGISLDKYMGSNYPLYKRFYYNYQRCSMQPEQIVPDCFSYYLLSFYNLMYHEGTCLLDLMMHSGKINYVVQQLLGYDNAGRAIGYTAEEQKWCEKYEEELMEQLQDKGHLYARDPMIIRHYMKPSPETELNGEEAPALLGEWIGARIIASYMKRHKDVSLKELLEMTDYHQMFKESGYQP